MIESQAETGKPFPRIVLRPRAPYQNSKFGFSFRTSRTVRPAELRCTFAHIRTNMHITWEWFCLSMHSGSVYSNYRLGLGWMACVYLGHRANVHPSGYTLYAFQRWDNMDAISNFRRFESVCYLRGKIYTGATGSGKKRANDYPFGTIAEELKWQNLLSKM